MLAGLIASKASSVVLGVLVGFKLQTVNRKQDLDVTQRPIGLISSQIPGGIHDACFTGAELTENQLSKPDCEKCRAKGERHFIGSQAAAPTNLPKAAFLPNGLGTKAAAALPLLDQFGFHLNSTPEGGRKARSVHELLAFGAPVQPLDSCEEQC